MSANGGRPMQKETKHLPDRSTNRLLSALPSEVLERLEPGLEIHNGGFKEVLYGQGGPSRTSISL